MSESLYAVVAIKQASKRGSYDILLHVCRTACRNGVAETEIGDRLVGLETGGRLWGDLRSPPRSPPFLAKIIDGGYHGGKRSQVTHRHVVLSVADPINYAAALNELRSLVSQWVERFLPGCPAWCVAYHADKAHVHAHVIASNWDESKGGLLDWKRRDVIYMNSLRWYNGPIEAGAGLQRAPERANRSKVYPLARTNLDTLLCLIREDPSARIASLLEDKSLVPYLTKGGNRGFIFSGQRLTERHINFELAKRFGVGLGPDGGQIPIRITRRTELQRQTLFDAQLGAMNEPEFSRYADAPLYALSGADWIDLNHGIMPQNRMFRRAARTAVFRFLRYGKEERQVLLGMKAVMDLLKALMLGDTAARPRLESPSGILAFILDLAADLSAHPIFRAHIPALGPLCNVVRPSTRSLPVLGMSA